MKNTNKMSASEFVKYVADNQIQFTLPEDNRKYPGQQCQDDNINKAFREFHEKIVNEIILFCKGWNITIDEVFLHADGLKDSIKFEYWQPCTDSILRFDKFNNEKNNTINDDQEPFLVNL